MVASGYELRRQRKALSTSRGFAGIDGDGANQLSVEEGAEGDHIQNLQNSATKHAIIPAVLMTTAPMPT